MTGDERAVANLVHRLAEAIDLGDLDAVEALFGDATFTLAGRSPQVGGAAFRRAIEEGMLRYEDGRPSTLHQIANLVVDVDDTAGVARARSSVTVLQARPDLPLQAILVGRYDDRFTRDDEDEDDGDAEGDTERGPGGWRWAARDLVIDLVGDTSRHTANRL